MAENTVRGPLGRVKPPNFEHVAKYAFKAAAPFILEKLLPLPPWHKLHNQGRQGACVGFGTSMMLAVLRTVECMSKGAKAPYVRYNPFWLWDRAKEVDPFPDSNPGDDNGTTVSAACDILRTKGHVIWLDENDPKSFSEVDPNLQIAANRWAQTIDDVRAALADNIPISIGVNWYEDFDTPKFINGESWIGTDVNNLGELRGGHCICGYGGSDQRKAVRLKNSWGADYPEVWLPYATLERLIHEDGEVALITDK
jgi:hypothetical protein